MTVGHTMDGEVNRVFGSSRMPRLRPVEESQYWINSSRCRVATYQRNGWHRPPEKRAGPPCEDFDEPTYPAVSFADPWIADYRSVLFGLEGCTGDNLTAKRGLKRRPQIRELTSGGWGKANAHMKEFLDTNADELKAMEECSNFTRFLGVLMSGINKLLWQVCRAAKK